MESSNAKGVKCNVNYVYLIPFGYELSIYYKKYKLTYRQVFSGY